MAFFSQPNATLALEDGTLFHGFGVGAVGIGEGELCFNTAMTGYQEILSDPSYMGQIITFTFPHIGITGTNNQDSESPASRTYATGAVFHAEPTEPSNWRAAQTLNAWLTEHNIVGIWGVDTRALTLRIREHGMVRAVLAHENPLPDAATLLARARALAPMEGQNLAQEVSATEAYTWHALPHELSEQQAPPPPQKYKVVVIDLGVKANILRQLAAHGCEGEVVPANTSPEDILARKPHGVLLSNGPGDPAVLEATIATTKALVAQRIPLFGICLGHQVLALALGLRTQKMHQGHHGANHPVHDLHSNKVEVVSMNHGFTVAADDSPSHLETTHISLFDGSNCGLKMRDAPVFSVQFHPEASPGPHDTHALFAQFCSLMAANV